MNEEILSAIEQHALTPEAIESVIALSERDDVQDQQAKLEREAKDLAKRIGRITDAIAAGGEMTSLMGKLRELETRQRTIEEQMRFLHPIPRLPPEVIADRLEEIAPTVDYAGAHCPPESAQRQDYVHSTGGGLRLRFRRTNPIRQVVHRGCQSAARVDAQRQGGQRGHWTRGYAGRGLRTAAGARSEPKGNKYKCARRDVRLTVGILGVVKAA
jgi:hypothetical protein